MRYKDIILEYNRIAIINQFEEKFIKKMLSDHTAHFEDMEVGLSQLDEYLKQNNIQKTIDPYVKWIIHRYVTDGIRYWEDVLSKVVPALVKYDKLKKKKKLQPNEMDINKFKGESDLLDVVEKYQNQDLLSGTEKEKQIEQQFYKRGDADLLMNTDEYKIVVPHTHEASCYFGRNTRWCTTTKDAQDIFFNYSKQSSLYIILHKPTNRRWQFHFYTAQYMDERDDYIDISNFHQNHPEVINFFKQQVMNNFQIPPRKIYLKVPTVVQSDDYHIFDIYENYLTFLGLNLIVTELDTELDTIGYYGVIHKPYQNLNLDTEELDEKDLEELINEIQQDSQSIGLELPIVHEITNDGFNVVDDLDGLEEFLRNELGLQIDVMETELDYANDILIILYSPKQKPYVHTYVAQYNLKKFLNYQE